MIVAAGLSPAWQQVLVFDALASGDVNRAAAAYWCASGKVLNVAVALHHLGGRQPGRSLAVSLLGGPAFEPIDREFAAVGIGRRWVRTATPTRVCTTLVEQRSGVVTELVENACPVTPTELDEFQHTFAEVAAKSTAVVLTGSLPQGAPAGYFRDLTRGLPVPAVLDIRGPELLAALENCSVVVKPNRAELAATLGQPIATDQQLHAAMAELLRRGAQAVVVTAGQESVWLATPQGCERFTPPRVEHIVNPIACGDCFAAGMAWAISHGRDLGAAIEQGMAAAAANLQTLLPSDFDGSRERLTRR